MVNAQLEGALANASTPETERTTFELALDLLKTPEIASAYEALYGDLRLACPPGSGNSILVTSTAPGEGKTTVSCCLAITASLAGQTALLVDGDLRRSSLTTGARRFGAAGLIDVMLGDAGPAEAIRPLPAPADPRGDGAVSFMAGGRKPATYLGAVDASKARCALGSIAKQFNFVFLDSPPILAASDALLFARIVDAVLLVVGTGNVDLNEIGRAKEQLASIGTPIIGAVFNRFESKLHGPSNRPYSGYYLSSRA